jgi:hypothetical protein
VTNSTLCKVAVGKTTLELELEDILSGGRRNLETDYLSQDDRDTSEDACEVETEV